MPDPLCSFPTSTGSLSALALPATGNSFLSRQLTPGHTESAEPCLGLVPSAHWLWFQLLGHMDPGEALLTTI